LTVLMIQDNRTAEQAAQAEADAVRGPVPWAGWVLGPVFSETRAPKTAQLLNSLQEDVRLLVRQANAAHPFRPRPRTVSGVQPSLRSELAPEMPHSSYPSARTLATALWAHTLAELYPAQAATLHAAARHSAWLRVIGGAHFPSDIESAQTLAAAAWPRLRNNPAFAQALASAQQEVAAAGDGRPAGLPAQPTGLLDLASMPASAVFGLPPPLGSSADLADLHAVLQSQAQRSPADAALAARWEQTDVWAFWRASGQQAGSGRLLRERLPATEVLLVRARIEIERYLTQARTDSALKRPRPAQHPDVLAREISTVWPSPAASAWPSAKVFSFATQTLLLAEALPAAVSTRLVPAWQTDLRRLGASRVTAGVHYPGDVQAALQGATRIAAALKAQPVMTGLLDTARKELASTFPDPKP
ncbi:MAG: hypothetical protein ACRCV9_01545, partial [Burkholderiaceae bacterium]